MPFAVVLALTLQTAGGGVVPPPTATTATAVRAAHPPAIDGRDDDPVWREAPAITQFREFQPKQDGDPRFATEAKVAYDDRNIYVFIRAFDPHPDSILRLLARRDVRAATDQLKIIIDSYHDRRSGYEFAVNPAGVKRDYAIYNDTQEDDAWDAVWEVATAVDSLGWTAEFRIPLSQLRYVPRGTNTFGFGVWRDIQRYTERVSWPLFRQSQSGISSQLGELHGLDGLPSPRRPGDRAVRGDEERVRATRQWLRPFPEGDRGRRPEVRDHLQPDARRDRESGLRPGGGDRKSTRLN